MEVCNNTYLCGFQFGVLMLRSGDGGSGSVESAVRAAKPFQQSQLHVDGHCVLENRNLPCMRHQWSLPTNT